MRALPLFFLFAACGATPGLKPYSDCQTVNATPGSVNALRNAPLSAELLVPDVDTGVAFYRDQLGFTVAHNDADVKSCFSVVSLDDDSILLAHVASAYTPLNGQVELRFMVPDVEATYARAKTGGVEFVRDLGTADYGLREFVVRDPYGVRLRFAMPVP